MGFKKISKQDGDVRNASHRLTTVLALIYMLALYWILLFKLGVQFSYMGSRRVNLTPFNQPHILTGENILNAVIFVPLGIYAGMLFKQWPFGQKLFFVFGMSLLLEALQFGLAVGAFDATDLLTNTFGGLIGLLLFNAIEKAFNNSAKANHFINRIAAAGTVVMIVLLALLKMNLLPIKYQ